MTEGSKGRRSFCLLLLFCGYGFLPVKKYDQSTCCFTGLYMVQSSNTSNKGEKRNMTKILIRNQKNALFAPSAPLAPRRGAAL